jgi:hypothetical protein
LRRIAPGVRIFDSNDNVHALFWTVEGETVTPIHLIGGNAPEPLGINDFDAIVGWDDSELLPLFWADPLAVPISLPLLAGRNRGVAENINNQGIIVGSCWGGGVPRAVAWQVVNIAGELLISDPIDLGALTFNGVASAIDVANSELIEISGDPILATRIAGISRDANGNTRSVMWEITSSFDEQGIPSMTVQTGPADLGTLAGDNENTLQAMNNHGDACGSPGSLTLYGMPMLPLTDLRTNAGGLSSPQDINDRTEIVGKFYYGVGEQATVLWQVNGNPVDLNTFTGGTGWSYLDTADGINNLGAITGWGTRYLNGRRNSPRVRAAFVMIPN